MILYPKCYPQKKILCLSVISYRFTRRQSIEILLLRQSTFLVSPSLQVCVRHAGLPITTGCCLVEGAGLKKPTRTGPDQFRWNLNSEEWKNSKKFLKILQVATNLMVSKFFKYSLIWYTLRAFEFKQKKRAYKSI